MMQALDNFESHKFIITDKTLNIKFYCSILCPICTADLQNFVMKELFLNRRIITVVLLCFYQDVKKKKRLSMI